MSTKFKKTSTSGLKFDNSSLTVYKPIPFYPYSEITIILNFEFIIVLLLLMLPHVCAPKQ